MRISQLYSYPLKGGHARRHSSTVILSSGLLNDRSWLLVNKDGQFISQRSHPALTQIAVSYVGHEVHFRIGEETLVLPFEGDARPCSVTVWKDRVTAYDRGPEASAFFSAYLKDELRLCQVGVGSERFIGAEYSDGLSPSYYFADSFPFLVITEESLDLLNDKLLEAQQTPVTMDRFRPNIVIEGWDAHAEDQVRSIQIGNKVQLRLAKPCTRCNVITIDQQSGQEGKEPLATLARYRKNAGGKIIFGMNAWLIDGHGEVLEVGDNVTLLD